jgi:hypothetical protein
MGRFSLRSKIRAKKVGCEKCGDWFPFLHIHHMDGNHSNNSNDNLAVLCPRCHILEHGKTPRRSSYGVQIEQLAIDMEGIKRIGEKIKRLLEESEAALARVRGLNDKNDVTIRELKEEYSRRGNNP